MASSAPAETVTLRNQRPVMLPPIHLLHVEVCANHGTCLCHRHPVAVATKRPPKGRRGGARVEARRFPHTLTLAAKGTEGDTLSGLPLEVLHSGELKAAVARGDVKSERVPIAAAQNPPASPPVRPSVAAAATAPPDPAAGDAASQEKR